MLRIQEAEKIFSFYLFTVFGEIRFRWSQGQAWQVSGT